MFKNIPKNYEPQNNEDKIYKIWEKSGYFNPDQCVKDKIAGKNSPYFSIILPPPNVTGNLHIGHSVMLAIQDALIRYHRMKGERTLWLPGTDHAAIATQEKVERILYEKEGKTRYDLGREEFLKRVEKFAQDSHNVIVRQIKKMGSSVDWSREAYTLDEKRNLAVRAAFKKMFDDGIIYRGQRIVNWDPSLKTTVSDDELARKEEKTTLYYLKYGPFTIATARPETKFGDKYVVMHPDDKRYQNYSHGQKIELKWINGPVTATVIKDKCIDINFGTGAMTITPWHDSVDFDIAERHKLDKEPIIDLDGKLLPIAGEFKGMKISEAREKIISKMESKGLVAKKEDNYIHEIAINSRGEGIIEPQIMEQWFINVNKEFQQKKIKTTLKKLMQEAVKSKKIEIIPRHFEKIYFHWIDNLRDWCVSRQLWYGHRIPVWYKKEGKTTLILVRHGQTDWNRKGIMQGQKDIPLNEKGKKDALKLRDEIKNEKFDIILTSPLKRTSETAKLLNSYKVKIIEDHRLKERSYGKFEGLKTNEILKDHPEIETFDVNGCPYWIKVPTAETYEELKARVRNFLEEIKNKYAGKRVMIVSHGDTLDMFYAVLNNLPDEKAYGRFSLNMHTEKYDFDNEKIYVGINPPEGKNWKQDEDTLDTWFSAGLWTFSALGWPEKTRDLKDYHPTSVMETGYDILFFWVARMILMSRYLLEGEIPFKKVYLHGLVRDEQGRKMSKSLGNVIDPLEVCEKYGTDAVRLSLTVGNSAGNDLKLNEEKIKSFKNFANKLWNISRYVTNSAEKNNNPEIKKENLTLSDHWILEEFSNLIEKLSADLEEFRFSQAGEQLRDFTWNKFSDWYLEISKFEKTSEKNKILLAILKDLLKLWHPFMPFVTENIWIELLGEKKLLMVEKWPVNEKYQDLLSASRANLISFDLIREIIRSLRNIRTANKIAPDRKIKAIIDIKNCPIHSEIETRNLISDQEPLIKKLRTGIESLEIISSGHKIKNSFCETVLGTGINIYIPSEGLVDSEKEIKRYEKEMAETEKYIENLENKLKDADFLGKAPEKIVNRQKEALRAAQIKLKQFKNRWEELK